MSISIKDLLLKIGVIDNASGALKKVSGAMGAVKTAAVGIGATGVAFGAWFKHQTDVGDELGTVSERVGMSAQAFSAWAHTLEMADVSLETFTAGMDKLNLVRAEAKLSKGEAYSLLSVAAPQLLQKFVSAKDNVEALKVIAGAMNKLTDSSKKALLARTIFGKSGAQFGVALAQGNEALLKQVAAYDKLSGKEDEFAAAAGAVDNALKEAHVPLRALSEALYVRLAPSIQKAIEAFGPMVEKLMPRFMALADRLGVWLENGGLGRLADGFVSVGEGIAKASDFLGTFGSIAAASLPIWGPLASALVSFGVSGYAALGPLGVALAAIAAAIAAIAAQWNDVKYIFDEMKNDTKWAVFDSVAKMQTPAAPTAAASMTPTPEGLGGWRGMVMDALGMARPVGVSSSDASGAVGAPREQRITVDFANAPKGTRVDNAGAPGVSWNLGFAMEPAL